jgi:hypothetical protein
MIIRTLKRTTFDKIKVGEVFALQSWWSEWWYILYKADEERAFLLSSGGDFFDNGLIFIVSWGDEYTLPKHVQRLWKEE